jgi:hypothetical protein
VRKTKIRADLKNIPFLDRYLTLWIIGGGNVPSRPAAQG